MKIRVNPSLHQSYVPRAKFFTVNQVLEALRLQRRCQGKYGYGAPGAPCCSMLGVGLEEEERGRGIESGPGSPQTAGEGPSGSGSLL